MKKHLLLSIALLVASGMLAAPGTSTLLAKVGPAWAQGRGEDHGDRDHGERGRRDKENRGQRKKWEREHEGRYRFNDDDRQSVDDYYRDHRHEFREHWRGEPPPLAYGYVIEPRYRRYCRPVPVVLLREMPPPPYGYRYFLFGGNVILVDEGYGVQDFIHLNINIGR